jgi:hypothetical protein
VLAYAGVGLFAKPLAGFLDSIANTSLSFQHAYLEYLGPDAASGVRMLTYADVCWRMLTYADVC